MSAAIVHRTWLENEAAACRRMVKDFIGRPEEQLLLRLASAMEELAVIEGETNEEGGFARRSLTEVPQRHTGRKIGG